MEDVCFLKIRNISRALKQLLGVLSCIRFMKRCFFEKRISLPFFSLLQQVKNILIGLLSLPF